MTKNSYKTYKYFILCVISFLFIIGGIFLGKFNKDSAPDITGSATVLTLPEIPPIDPKIKEFGLEISKLNILVPIIENVDGNDKIAYNAALKKGVAHFAGTAFPGEKGNIFIFGHSSAEVKSDYSKTFANLNDLEKSDKISVYYRDIEHTYMVQEKKIVEATDLSVLDKSNIEVLTIMTCWPVGTSEQRLIIISKKTD